MGKQVDYNDGSCLPQDPIFIIGCPRSGTTLLQALLATQGNIVTFPETHFFDTLGFQYKNIPETIHSGFVSEFLAEITKASGVEFSEQDRVLLGDSERITVKDLFEFVVERFLPENLPDDFRWLEKTPDHAFSLEELESFYPQAKFVGIVRHPLPVIFSRTKNFPPKVQDPLKYLAEQWVLYSQSLEKFKISHPDKIIIIKYEDLAVTPSAVVSVIVDFLSVKFDPAAFAQRIVKANTIIKPFEHWKMDVMNPKIENNNGKVGKLFSLTDTLKIQSIVFDSMRRSGYLQKYLILQFFYQTVFLQLPKFFKKNAR